MHALVVFRRAWVLPCPLAQTYWGNSTHFFFFRVLKTQSIRVSLDPRDCPDRCPPLLWKSSRKIVSSRLAGVCLALFQVIDPRVMKIRNEVSSCPGIFSRHFVFARSLAPPVLSLAPGDTTTVLSPRVVTGSLPLRKAPPSYSRIPSITD